MASGHDVRPFRDRNQTPDSVHRGSFIQIPPNVGTGNTGPGSTLRNGTPPVEKEGDLFRFVFLRSRLRGCGFFLPRSSNNDVIIWDSKLVSSCYDLVRCRKSQLTKENLFFFLSFFLFLELKKCFFVQILLFLFNLFGVETNLRFSYITTLDVETVMFL